MHTKPQESSAPGTLRPVARKWIIAIACVAAVFAGLGAFKFFQIRAAMAGHMAFSMPPEAITSVVVQEQQWPGTLTAVGTIKPVNGLTLRADLAGNVESIGFESGAKMRKGDLLVQQDITEEQAQLRAAQARQQLAEANLRRFKGLLDKRVSSQSDYDATAAEYLQAQAKCQEISAVIEKKTIRAPFDGMAGIRMVNDGEYLQPGQQIVPFQSMSPIYANFTLPQQNLSDVRIGSVVKVFPSGAGGKAFEGKVTAVNSVVDEATRNFLVQATLENPEGLLRPGMYVGVEVVLLTIVGLSAKNAILIVEFAKANFDGGMGLVESALAASRQRLRPILMTSCAFMLGVLPLAVSTGAGSGGQNAIGTGVIGGTFSATFFGILFIPLFFVAVLRLFRVKPRRGLSRALRAADADGHV